MSDYYVYVCIDPRNYEEFYYGKGSSGRKDSHPKDESDSEKVKRIKAIVKQGLQPIIRVIARDLTEAEAFLIEKTLLWRLGGTLTNKATGNFSEKFRSRYSLHSPLSGFDYKEGLYHFNVGEGPHRTWEDCKRFGFISAGQGVRWRDAILALNEGDLIAAYLKKRGFVGIGRIVQAALPIREVSVQNMLLIKHGLKSKRAKDNLHSDTHCEYVALVKWERAVDAADAKWGKKSELYTTQLIRSSLENQPKTVKFLEREFEIKFDSLRELRI